MFHARVAVDRAAGQEGTLSRESCRGLEKPKDEGRWSVCWEYGLEKAQKVPAYPDYCVREKRLGGESWTEHFCHS